MSRRPRDASTRSLDGHGAMPTGTGTQSTFPDGAVMRQKAEVKASEESSPVAEPQQALPDAQHAGQLGIASSFRRLQRTQGNRFVQRLLKPGTVQRTAANQHEPQGVPSWVHDVL